MTRHVTTITRAATATTTVGALAAGAALPWIVSRKPLRQHVSLRFAGRGRPDHVALTFDDGPDPDSTPRILGALDELGVRATFFLLGEAVDEHPALVGELADAGHEVAVHGFTHRWHLTRTPSDLRDDIARAYDAVVLASGRQPRWFRPPYGSPAWGSITAAHRVGLRTVMWTTWGRDWRPGITAADVAAEVFAGLDGGGTILLHDSDRTSAPGCWRATLAALPLVVEACRRHGWSVGPLAEHGLPEERWPRW